MLVLHYWKRDVPKVIKIVNRIDLFLLFLKDWHRSCRNVRESSILQFWLSESTLRFVSLNLWECWSWISFCDRLLFLPSNFFQFGNLLSHSTIFKEIITKVIWALIRAHSSSVKLVYRSLLGIGSVQAVIESFMQRPIFLF